MMRKTLVQPLEELSFLCPLVKQGFDALLEEEKESSPK
jgi:hypothetical protein